MIHLQFPLVIFYKQNFRGEKRVKKYGNITCAHFVDCACMVPTYMGKMIMYSKLPAIWTDIFFLDMLHHSV